MRQDVERLEDEAEAVAPQQRQRVVLHGGYLLLAKQYFSGIDRLEPGDDVEQSGLADARLAHDRDVLASAEAERNAVEDGASAEALADGLECEHRCILLHPATGAA